MPASFLLFCEFQMSTAPVAVDDTNAGDLVQELAQAGYQDTRASGRLLANDSGTGPDDTLAVTGIRNGDEAGSGSFAMVPPSTASVPWTTVFGVYGYISVFANGRWDYQYGSGLGGPTAHNLTQGEIAHDVFTYQVTSSDGLTDTAQIDISIIGEDNYPQLSVIEHDYLVYENTVLVTAIHATDADSTFSYVISGGADAGKFTIDATTGVLSFITPPDYEHPGDADHDNIYNVWVAANDGYGQDATGFSVHVWDASDAPPAADSPLSAIDWVDYTAPSTIRVFFAEDAVNVEATYDGASDGAFTNTGWTDTEIAAVKSVYSSFAAIANIHIQYVDNVADADFVLAKSPDANVAIDGAYGYWDVGGASLDYGGTTYDIKGIGVFNTDSSEDGVVGDPEDFWSDASLQPGGFAYAILLHELGHGLGLAHPHDEGGGSTIMSSVAAANYVGDYELNQGVYTIMTYNDGWPFEPDVQDMWTPGPDTYAYGWQSTPMALDVATLQLKYGQAGHSSGNDTYVLADANTPGTGFATIWDIGGNDTIRYDGSKDVHINLASATLDYSWSGGGGVSYASGVRGGFTIANGVVIENAIGGSGNDWFVANDATNRLDGGAGTDMADYSWCTKPVSIALIDDGQDVTGAWARNIENLIGSAGNDTLRGNSGDNHIDGYLGTNMLNGGAGEDWVDFSSIYSSVSVSMRGDELGSAFFDGGRDSFYNFEDVQGGHGDDNLTGDSRANKLYGGAGNDWLDGKGGVDTLNGGAGDNDIANFSGRAHGLTVTLNGSHLVSAKIGGVLADRLANIEGIIGTFKADHLIGDSRGNYFKGAQGGDVIDGRGGIDIVDYSDKDRGLHIELHGSQTIGVKVGTTVEDHIRNVEGVIGTYRADTLIGDGNSREFFQGWLGKDTIDGGGGSHDTVDYEERTAGVVVTLRAGSNTTVRVGGRSEDTIRNVEDVNGGQGKDHLGGDTKGNEFHGYGGNDVLLGQSGNDTLDGGGGRDTLSGGSGADRFVFDDQPSSDSVDIVRDFSERTKDKIVLDDYWMDLPRKSGHLATAAFHAAAGASDGHDPDDRIIYNTSNGKLYYDYNGSASGGVTQIAQLSNHAHLSAGDIVIV